MGCCAAKDTSFDKSPSPSQEAQNARKGAVPRPSSIPLHSEVSPSSVSPSTFSPISPKDVSKSIGKLNGMVGADEFVTVWTFRLSDSLTRSLLFKASKSASFERTTLRLRSPSEILPAFLFLGNQKDAANLQMLTKNNIAVVINVAGKEVNFSQEQLTLMQQQNIQLHTFEIDDVESADISKFFKPVISLIENARENRRAVLLHCQQGVSRSATLVIAYLLTHCEADENGSLPSLQKCYEHVEYLRPIICPNYGFLKALMAYEKNLRSIPESTLSVSGIGQNSGKINAAIDEATKSAISELAREEEERRRIQEQQEQIRRTTEINSDIQRPSVVRYPPPLSPAHSLAIVSSSSSSSSCASDDLPVDTAILSSTGPSSSGSHPLTRESNAHFDGSIALFNRSYSTISPKSASRQTDDGIGRRKTDAVAITAAQLHVNMMK